MVATVGRCCRRLNATAACYVEMIAIADYNSVARWTPVYWVYHNWFDFLEGHPSRLAVCRSHQDRVPVLSGAPFRSICHVAKRRRT